MLTVLNKVKARNSEINAAPFCVDNVSKDFLVNNMNKTELYWCVYDFSNDYDINYVGSNLDICKYLIKRHDAK